MEANIDNRSKSLSDNYMDKFKLDNALIIIALECKIKHTNILTFNVIVLNENIYSLKLGLGSNSMRSIHKIS
jgi:hypothetical protein